MSTSFFPSLKDREQLTVCMHWRLDCQTLVNLSYMSFIVICLQVGSLMVEPQTSHADELWLKVTKIFTNKPGAT
jgi:hypothetical protein